MTFSNQKNYSILPSLNWRTRRRLVFAVLLGGWVTLFAFVWLPGVMGQQRQPTNQSKNQPQQQPQQQTQQGNANTIQVVATVNGHSITRDQLAHHCAVRFGEEVLQSMMNRMLVMRELQKIGHSISEQDVMNELTREAERYGLSLERYIQVIFEERHISLDKLKNDITWTRLALRRLASGRTTVSNQEVADRMQFEFGPKVQVRAIACSTLQEAENILAYVRQNPEEFGRVAKEKSVDPQSASVRGLLPPIRRNMGEPVMERAAFSLQVNEISPVIELEHQFIILKCEQHFPADNLNPEQRMAAEKRIEEQLREERLGEVAVEIFKQLQETAEIVNVYNDPELRQRNPGIAATINGTPITLQQLYEECISIFGHDVLTAEINRVILLQELQKANVSISDKEIQDEVERAALNFGFMGPDGAIDMERWLAYVTKGNSSKLDIYIQDEVWPSAAVRKLVAPSVSVTKEDMERGFQANFGERVECLAIVLNDERLAQRVWQQAKNDPTEEAFGKLANQYSIDPTSRANNGQVPPIQRFGGRPMLEDEAFNLRPGEISQLIKLGPNIVILFCQGRTTPRVQDFDAVKDELYSNILEKKLRIAMAEKFDVLTQSAEIYNFLTGTSQPGNNSVRQARETPNMQR
ncbi:MAG TPA: peptidylprolyl isomerase [Pirellulaceae bacterium]|nr:peptidylprolyl isomerase [Pirellulaceae bacterium]HMO93283.1 peptidylprolyl isomerase [Pirellulaceae bacterium]HMP70177.1 peptidylprolyl isomerase [Pirellulaceae bacterium]